MVCKGKMKQIENAVYDENMMVTPCAEHSVWAKEIRNSQLNRAVSEHNVCAKDFCNSQLNRAVFEQSVC